MPKKQPPDEAPDESATESAATMPTLIPRPNGHGALLSGGMPGNRGSNGRPRSEIRDRAARLYDELGMEFLTTVLRGERMSVDVIGADGKVKRKRRIATIKERKEAADSLARVGLGEHHEATVDDVRHRIQRQLTVMRERLAAPVLERMVAEGRAAEVYPDIIEALRPIWAA